MIFTKEYQSTTHPLPLTTLTFTAESTFTETLAICPPLNGARITVGRTSGHGSATRHDVWRHLLSVSCKDKTLNPFRKLVFL